MTMRPVSRPFGGAHVVTSVMVGGVGALSSALSGSALAAVIGAVVGVGWALLLGRLAGRFMRSEEQHARIANRSVSVAATVAAVLFGGSLFAIMYYLQALSTPAALFSFIGPPSGGGLAFFLVFNPLLEWILLPLAIHLNWTLPRRRWLIVAPAVLFYLARAWTYLYFAPVIFDLGTVPPAGPFEADVLARVATWVNLSVVRAGIDGLLAISLAVAIHRAVTTSPDPGASSSLVRPAESS